MSQLTGVGIVNFVNVLPTISEGVTMREKRGGAMSKMQKLRKRLSLSFGRLSTKDDPDGDVSECRGRQQNGGGRGKLPYNGYSEECLDRLEPNGNIPHDKEPHYGEDHNIFMRLE
ncbi:uncharacterized protein LOC114351033 isoform X2 [Ostrinia furnacalis]|uniref:uncharacterized protein LOC114351033 isoform X2 n=1 Tax=Ostrinia furnacalis TaxID=93504 RepID=UPI00103EE65F|nr:uncharacterized protein LOC114351033 isoform X2 [Ostrinia furnacalis]